MRQSLLPTIGAAALWLALAGGCGDDRPSTRSYDEQPPATPTAYEPLYGPAYEPPPFVPPFAPFDVPLGQSVTIGAFVLDFEAAHVEPAHSPFEPLMTVTLDFEAHNVSNAAAYPLGRLLGSESSLEVAGKHFFGETDAARVPSLKSGVGSLRFAVTHSSVTPDDLRHAILTLGGGRYNEAVIPFSDPSMTTSLADIELPDQFSFDNYRTTDLAITSVRVQYNDHVQNTPLAAASAWLVVEGTLSARPEFTDRNAYLRWYDDDFFLDRPDGFSVAPHPFYEGIQVGEREPMELRFDLGVPVAGTYTFGMRSNDLPTVTHELVVP